MRKTRERKHKLHPTKIKCFKFLHVSGYLSSKDLLTELRQRFVELSPYILDYNNTAPKEIHHEIALLALKEYMDNQPIAEETYDNFIQVHVLACSRHR